MGSRHVVTSSLSPGRWPTRHIQSIHAIPHYVTAVIKLHRYLADSAGRLRVFLPARSVRHQWRHSSSMATGCGVATPRPGPVPPPHQRLTQPSSALKTRLHSPRWHEINYLSRPADDYDYRRSPDEYRVISRGVYRSKLPRVHVVILVSRSIQLHPRNSVIYEWRKYLFIQYLMYLLIFGWKLAKCDFYEKKKLILATSSIYACESPVAILGHTVPLRLSPLFLTSRSTRTRN